VRVLVAVISIVTIAATALACTNTRDSDPNAAPQATASPTAGDSTITVHEPPPTIRAFCEAALPAAWKQAIDGGRANTGKGPTVPTAVGPAGEVVAVRDNGDSRDLLLIGADKSVTKIYAVPAPDLNNVGFVAMDDRWILVGVNRIPRHSNGVAPGLIRVDVIDRQGGAVRTVAHESEVDYRNGRNAIDSVALFGGKVYWVTRAAYADPTGVVTSNDPVTGAVADVPSSGAHDLRTTAAGLTWAGEGPGVQVRVDGPLPGPVAAAVGTGQDAATLATDGTAYAWITGTDQGGTGVAWWSQATGLVRVTGKVVAVDKWLPPVYVVGPYVLIEKGRPDQRTQQNSFATVVDTRSGAVTYLPYFVAGGGGGTMAIGMGDNVGRNGPSAVGVVRADALPPLAC
jgi:hypothetical protein